MKPVTGLLALVAAAAALGPIYSGRDDRPRAGDAGVNSKRDKRKRKAKIAASSRRRNRR